MRSAGRLAYALGPVALIAAVLASAYSDIVFEGGTLSSAVNSTGVMNEGAPYGYGTPVANPYRLDPGAFAWAPAPWTVLARRQILDGTAPLWDASMGTGMPLLANAQSAPFNPWKLPLLASTEPLAWDLYLLGRLLAGGALVYLLVRCLQWGALAGVTAATVFVLNGHFVLHNNNHWIDVYLSLPPLLLGIELTLRRGGITGPVVTALSTAVLVLAGMPEATFLCGLFAACWATYRAWQTAAGAGALAKNLALVGGAGIVGLGLSAPMLLPFEEYVGNAAAIHPNSPSLHAGVGKIFESPDYAVSLLVPYFWGLPLVPIGTQGGAHVINYFGVAPVFLAFVALFARGTRRPVVYLVLALLLFGLAKTYGVPVVNELGRLPLFDRTIFPKYAAPILALCVALLAAAGVDALSRRRISALRVQVAALATVVTLGVVFVLARAGFDLMSGEHLRETVGFGIGMLALAWLACTVAAWRQHRWLVAAPVLVVAAELLAYAPHAVYPDRYDPYTEAPFVTFLRSRQDEGRVFSFENYLGPNTASAFDIPDIRALDAIYPDRYFTYIRTFVQPLIGDSFKGTEEPPAAVDNVFFDLAGVRYVITSFQGISRFEPLQPIDLAQLGVAAGAANTPPNQLRDSITLDDARQALVLGGGTETKIEIDPTSTWRIVKFAAGFDPTVPGADRRQFDVLAEYGGAQELLLSVEVGPAVSPSWQEVAVDFSSYIDKPGTRLVFHANTPGAAEGEVALAGLRLSGPSDDSRGTQFEQLHQGSDNIIVYENLRAFPRAFLANAVVGVQSPADALALMGNETFDPRTTVVVEAVPGELVAGTNSSPAAPITRAEIVEYGDDFVEVEARAEGPSVLVLTDTFYPGWRAEIDGEEAAIYVADYLFRGVFLPGGTHTVIFRYEPSSFRWGVVIAAVSAGAAAAYIVVAVVAARRARRGDGSTPVPSIHGLG